MGKKRRSRLGFEFSWFLALILCSGIQVCWSLNDEGLILIAFRARINSDPFGALENWNPADGNPCLWSRVYCVDGKVRMLNMTDLALEGTLAPELGRLSHLRALVLYKNHFSGTIPEEIAELENLKLLDLRENNFSLTKPTDRIRMPSLKRIFARRGLLEASNLQAAPASGESASGQVMAPPMTRSSGVFRAVPLSKKKPSPAPSPLPSSAAPAHDGHASKNPNEFSAKTIVQYSSSGTSAHVWKYLVAFGSVAVLLIIAAAMFCMYRSKAVTTIGPWKTGLSGQLQKAFITGVPKLNRSELVTACEDFSNIISTFDGCTVYKGTLSSGVEIAVASTTISSFKDWTKAADVAYRKKIDTLSRVNHKNFVNLIGYCDEDEPFVRMMVFEYAPNGSLFEHLHVKEVEHLDWNARMRIVMGAAYCLQYMHHDINPPIAHPNLNSTSILLTDDYAAKIAEVVFSRYVKAKYSSEDDKENSLLPLSADPETNIYSFGVLLLEIISGKLPYSEEQGSLVNWGVDYLNDKRSISCLIDPSLKSFKKNELDVLCEVIQECIQTDPRDRPTMKEVTSKLREVITISPDQATPRLSPLWWAELEILSVEAT